MSEDMSNLMDQINNMIKNDQIPDNIKNMINNLKVNNSSDDNSKDTNSTSADDNSAPNTSSGIDIGTMMKMKKIVDSMNSNKNDPRANLLLSLKPYLKSSRKEKVDQYIQIFNMGKVFEMLNPLGR